MQARFPGTAVLARRSPLDPAVGAFRAEPASPGTAPAPVPAVTRDRRPLARLTINRVLSALQMVVLARVLLTLARRPPGQLR